jgi:hypothetical protein
VSDRAAAGHNAWDLAVWITVERPSVQAKHKARSSEARD